MAAVLAEAYDAGETVSFGRVRLSQEGITVGGYAPAGELIPWPEVRSVHLTYINPAEGTTSTTSSSAAGAPRTNGPSPAA